MRYAKMMMIVVVVVKKKVTSKRISYLHNDISIYD